MDESDVTRFVERVQACIDLHSIHTVPHQVIRNVKIDLNICIIHNNI